MKGISTEKNWGKKHYKIKNPLLGFTLIELLAVIAILAILVVVAVPTVLKLFNNAKENTFVTQAQNLYKTAEQQYMISAIKGEEKSRYYFSESMEENKLSTSGTSKVYYDIEIENGKINKIIVSDENYSISLESEEKVKIEEIKKEVIKKSSEVGYIDVGSGETYTAKVYGAYWDGSTNSILTRTDDAVGLTYQVNDSTITSDFDNEEIYKEMIEVTDEYGNVFIKIPKFYIKKTVDEDTWKWQISKQKKDSGYYLPACFTEESTGKVYPYILVGKYDASLSSDNKLESKSNKEVLVNKTIDEFRNYAKTNGEGYQILDIHVVDLLQVLFNIEYATLDSQSIMKGFSEGTSLFMHSISSVGSNTITLASGLGSNYRVGQMIDITTGWGVRNIVKNLRITSISGDTLTYEEISGISAVLQPIIPTSHFVHNVSYLTGTTNSVNSKSGSPESNSDGEYAMKYRGIENLYGNIHQFVDGVNIKDRVAYIAKDASQYVSDVFTGEYTALGYPNASTNNYAIKMGYDANNPYANFPIEVGIIENSAYKDFYYQNTGNRIAFVGGAWDNGTSAGLSYWPLSAASTSTSINIGSRLLKTPL